MGSVIKLWAGPGITFLVGLGFTVSGFQHVWVGYGIWIVAAIWTFFVLPPIRKRIPFLKSVELIQEGTLEIEAQSCNVLDFWPQPEHSLLRHMNIVNVKAKFCPLGEIKLRSLELHIGRRIFNAKRLPVIVIDHEDTYYIDFEVPNLLLQQTLGKPDRRYIRALFDDRDCRSNEFGISIVGEQLESKSNNVLVPKRPSPELFIEIDNYDFGFGGGGYPPKRFDDDNALWLRLGVTFRMNQTMLVESLHLLLSGESIPSYEWAPGRLVYYFYFEMPQWAKPGDVRTIQLVAFAKGTKWGSEEKEIRIAPPP